MAGVTWEQRIAGVKNFLLDAMGGGGWTPKGLEQRLDMMGWDYIIISGVNKS